MKALILAAGEGTRFRPHTLELPKPAIPFLNIPMGYYALPWLRQAGIQSLVVNTFHLPEKVQSLFDQQKFFDVEYSHELGKILGSGGGLKNAAGFFKSEENILLLNSDEVYLAKETHIFEKLITKHEQSNAISTLLVTEHSEVGTKFGGVWVNDKNQVIGFGKIRPNGAVRGYHFLGSQVLSKKIFDYFEPGIEQNILYDGLTKAMQAGHSVQLLEIQCEWYETGNLVDYLVATHQVLKHISNQTQEGLNFLDLVNQLDQDSSLEKVNDTLIWKDKSASVENSKVVGFAVLGKNTKIKNCFVKQSVLNHEITVKDQEIERNLILS